MRKNPLIGLVLFLVFSFYILFMGLGELQQYLQFQGKVELVTGTVDHLHSGSGRRSSNQASYSYTDRSGVTHQVQSQKVAASTVSLLKTGGSVPVKYLAEVPETSRIDLPGEEEWEWRKARNLSLFGGVFLVIGLSLLYWRKKF